MGSRRRFTKEFKQSVVQQLDSSSPAEICREYETFDDAYANINHFIGLVYNEKRLHSSIGYVPPTEFEQEILNKESLN